ncbi:ABC transporter substrate-binding protein [Longispora albida]|uniref:ABC transporter substrate-binding protein n=1 Tax=Longispora albida TaxID=203523 RepID=UPI00036DF366|nr:ABC transporter substrate-binding protein [Longispora albida]
MTITIRRTLAVLLAAVLLPGCGSNPVSTGTAADARGCLTAFDPAKDYFPVKSAITHAKNFTLRYEKSYQVLTVQQPYPQGKPESYVLLRCGAPKPDVPGAQVIETPVRSLYSGSTTHLPLLADLGRLDVLAGVSNAGFVVNPEVRKRIAEKKVAEYGANNTLDAEQVIVAKPDVLMTGGTDKPEYATLRKAGVPVLANAEWLESTPLGRAEWLKVMAALTGDEGKAATAFATVERDYTAVVAKAAKATAKTPVLPGTMNQGTWYMPAGGSYMARLLADAGASYPWSGGTETGSLKLSFEAVYAQAGQSPIWLADSQWKTLADARKADARYGELAAVKTGKVWSNTLVIGPGGGNDYWERGVTRPDLVLADLFAIVHPDLAPGHTFAFYRPVPA